MASLETPEPCHARQLAAFVAELAHDDIPRAVRHEAERLALDLLGCALGGWAQPDARPPLAVVQALGGAPEATVIGDGARVPAPLAAFVNTRLANLLDADDVFRNVGHHSPVAFFPALAVAERVGASGRELVTAFVAGYEVGARVVLALGSMFELVDGTARPRDTTGFGHSIFAGAAAAGRLLGLDAACLAHALGIAGANTPAPLSHKSLHDQAHAKYQLDWTAAGAVMGALLAAAGQAGPVTILDDDHYPRAIGYRTLAREELVRDLGQRWRIAETSLKLYPHCRHTHYALDALGAILDAHQLAPEEIERIVIRGLGSYTVPPWSERRPRTTYAAQFSLPYAVAMRVLGVPPGPAWHEPARFADPAVHALADRVELVADPRLRELIAAALPQPLVDVPTTVTVWARGRQFEATVHHARGDGFDPACRLTDDEVVAKFRRLTDPVLPRDQQDRLIERALGLDRLARADMLTALASLRRRDATRLRAPSPRRTPAAT